MFTNDGIPNDEIRLDKFFEIIGPQDFTNNAFKEIDTNVSQEKEIISAKEYVTAEQKNNLAEHTNKKRTNKKNNCVTNTNCLFYLGKNSSNKYSRWVKRPLGSEHLTEEEMNSECFLNFKRSIRNQYTFSTYKHSVNSFCKFTKLRCTEIKQLNELDLHSQLAAWIEYMNERGLRRRTIRTILEGMERFLSMNLITYHKKTLHCLIRGNDKDQIGGNVPFSDEDIRKMLESTDKLRTKAVIHFLKDTGARPRAMTDPVLRLKHLVPMPYGCYAVRIYDEAESGFSDSSRYGYWAFMTPEGRKAIDKYIQSRKLNGEKLSAESPLFSAPDGNVDYLTLGNLYTILRRIYKQAGVDRKKIDARRYDKAIVYGFRKRFDTILKIDNSINSNIAEKLMAHTYGLDGNYLKPNREQCFAEFVKAIPALTVSEAERQKLELEKKDKEILELESTKELNKDLGVRVGKLERAILRDKFLGK